MITKKPNAKALEIIKKFEGLHLSAYPDPLSKAEPYTIGYGTTSGVRKGDRITQKEAEHFLARDVLDIEAHLESKIPMWHEIDTNKQACLISFAYNLGKYFYKSAGFETISACLEAGPKIIPCPRTLKPTKAPAKDSGWNYVPYALRLYINPGSVVETGLLRRRNAEAELWGTKTPVTMSDLKITALQDTYLKKSELNASDLNPEEKVLVKASKIYTIDNITEIAGSAHSIVTLAYGAGTWHIYTPHWSFNYSQASKPHTEIDWSDMSTKLSKYFTLGEFLVYDTRRIPQSDEIKKSILILAKELDKIREAWGHPITITSGYRPPTVNAAVGGVRNSRHLLGDAVDIAPQGQSIVFFQNWLDARWFGALGYGARKGFVHIDMRNSKGFDDSKEKGPRWNY